MIARVLVVALCGVLIGCASREDRQWRDLQTILQIQDTR